MNTILETMAVLLFSVPAQQHNIEWLKIFDTGNRDCAYAVAVDSQNSIYATGASYIGADDDYLTVKYNFMGNILSEDMLDRGNYGYYKYCKKKQ